MAFAEITFKKVSTGDIINSPIGYAYDFAIFGPIALLFRLNMREIIIGGAIIVFYIIAISIAVPLILSIPIIHMVLAGCVNKCRIIQLIKEGYQATYISNGQLEYASALVGREIPVLQEEFDNNMKPN